jgi:hypothetical protein
MARFVMPDLEIDATAPAELPPNPPILGDFRAKTASKSPRISLIGIQERGI